MLLQRTEKARLELLPGVRNLGQRERSVLLLADGRMTLHDFGLLFNGEGERIALALLADGYLRGEEEEGGAPARPRAPRARSIPAPGPVPAPGPAPAPPPAPAPSAADPFIGKRSLATTRMFLFDLCERMFARRDPVLAERFREALRAAKDRDSMLAAGREMLAEVERLAGPERADSISERIAMLLPPEEALG